MSTAYEEEAWRRVMNACMVMAGALVIRPFILKDLFATLSAPFDGLEPGRSARSTA
jgi:hypothetical protein